MKHFFIIFLLLWLSACSLDRSVEDEITGLESIDDVAIASEVLAAIYIDLPKTPIELSILADDFYPNRNISTNKNSLYFYNWQPNELIDFSNQQWAGYYNCISKANVLLSRIDLIPTHTKKESEELRYIKAQTLAAKAYAYLNLIKLYTPNYTEASQSSLGIILKENVGAEHLPRATVEASYKATEALLLEAIDLFPENCKENFRFSIKTVQVLLAELYLFWNQYEKCEMIIQKILPSIDLSTSEYKTLWENPQYNREVLLGLENYQMLFRELYSTSSEPIYYVNRTISFNDNDIRKTMSVVEQNFLPLYGAVYPVYFWKKYIQNIEIFNIKKPLAMVRTAKVYLMLAEAQYQQYKKTEALQTLNYYLEARGVSPLSNSTDFMSHLLEEKQKEFLGEGERYFDLKRSQSILYRVDPYTNEQNKIINPDDFRWLLPIPSDEIRQNKNAIQNPHWDQYMK